MTYRIRLAVAAILIAGSAAAGGHGPGAAALELHDRLLTIDTHIDIGPHFATDAQDPGQPTIAQVDLPGMRTGGLDAGVFVVFTPQRALDAESYATARASADRSYAAIRRMLEAHPDQAALATTADEVEAIVATGRRAILIGMENAYPLGPTLDDVALWADRGLAYVGLTHFGNNQFGGSSNPVSRLGDADEDPGLTDLGRALVAALNDHGIMVDISHVGPRTSREAIAASRAPVIASHSGAKGVYDNARNLDDDQLRALRDNGGVAQMVAFRSYVAAVDAEMSAALKEVRERHGITSGAAYFGAAPEVIRAFVTDIRATRAAHPDVTLAQFVDHIDHAVSVAGIDHVGLSGDFDGGGGVKGWDRAEESANVTAELLSRGYSEEDIAKLWGGNVLRVMRAVEAAATR